MRYPGKPDVLLNLGSRFGELASPGTKLISIRLDPTSLARNAPVDLPIVADLRLAIADLTAAIRSMATASRLKEIADERAARTAAYSAQMGDARHAIARGLASSTPVSLERLGLELEANLDRDTCYVTDADSGKTMDALMTFGGNDKQYFSTSPNVLGWGMAAAFGVKLARPDVPVVVRRRRRQLLLLGPAAVVEHGALQGAGDQSIVLNNHSYNNERNRIWNTAGRQFETARDMTCYLGDPDVNYAKAADARSASKARRSRNPAPSRAHSPAPRARRWRAGLICSTFTSSARGSARCPNGIRVIRSPTCAPEGVIMRVVALSGLLVRARAFAAASPLPRKTPTLCRRATGAISSR
jgi:TPP-dependent trihydroxycyclohexane-1,2-dione (THcHDO) dehydratase